MSDPNNEYGEMYVAGVDPYKANQPEITTEVTVEKRKFDPSAPTELTQEQLKNTLTKMFHKPRGKNKRIELVDDKVEEVDAAMEEELQLLKEWNEAYDKAGGRARAARRILDKKYGKKGFSIGSYKRK